MNPAPTGHGTGKAARILAAAEELLVRRGYKGVTIAEVAQKAHVAKGTVYLYWRTKESLFLGLLARDFGNVLTDLAARIRDRPELARPDRLCPLLVESILRRPLASAMQTGDGDLLGSLAEDPVTREIGRDHGAAALIRDLLPVWRRHGMARTDQPEDRQTYALQTIAVGYLHAPRLDALLEPLDAATRHDTVAAVVRAVLDTPDTTAAEAVRDVIDVLARSEAALRTITGD